MQTIAVLEGDQTGQELLEEALRVLAADVIGVELSFPRFDLSLEHRRATTNGVVHEAAAAIREHGFGLKAATVTPEAAGDVGSPNRILREEIGGKVMVRTGRRIPGVVPLGGCMRRSRSFAYGTAPSLQGKDVANPMAMILAGAALLSHADDERCQAAGRAIREASLEAVAEGIRTADLGGDNGTRGYTDEVIRRTKSKLEVWASL
jgi:isocitrate/isopropylmalate dehydrogenase